MELEIHSRNVAMPPRWKTEIETRMEDLQRGHDDVIHGRVTSTMNRHHKKLANVAEALIVITLPGRHTLTARKEDKTFEKTIRTAFHAVGVELRRYREKRAHTDIHLPSIPPHCCVVSKLFPHEGHGFILKERGGEVYFHANALQDLAFEQLEDEVDVVFGLEEGDKGPQVTVLSLPQPIAVKVS
ncbi:MAG TPA: HPF/RaiA family ribosome-associated protein [Nitrospira sp.]|nr:HPF/RaiA family ribosome-associated protein [Nitrospira sp.]